MRPGRKACLLCLLSGAPFPGVTARATSQGSTPPTAAPPAAPWRPRGKRTGTSMAPSSPGSRSRRRACPVPLPDAMALGTSAAASSHTAGECTWPGLPGGCGGLRHGRYKSDPPQLSSVLRTPGGQEGDGGSRGKHHAFQHSHTEGAVSRGRAGAAVRNRISADAVTQWPRGTRLVLG